MNKTLLYIGNILSKHGFNKTTIETLGPRLEAEGYKINYASSKISFFYRLFEMIKIVLLTPKPIDYLIIDTYSTRAFWFSFITSQIARIRKINYIPILHGGDLPKRLQSSPTMSKMLFKYAYKNIAPSKYLLNEFNLKGYKNVLYIPNTIEIESYNFKKRKNFKPKLLWVRAFASIYNPKMAIDVLLKVKEKFPGAELTMVGPDKDGSMELVKQYADKLKLNVCFTNRLSKEEWITLSEDFDFFINTTHFDNTPISVMEAMALGLPIISTNVGGISYLLAHQENAILVNDNDSLAMANAIVELVNNPQKATLMTENARLFVEEMDWTVVKTKWNKLLN